MQDIRWCKTEGLTCEARVSSCGRRQLTHDGVSRGSSLPPSSVHPHAWHTAERHHPISLPHTPYAPYANTGGGGRGVGNGEVEEVEQDIGKQGHTSSGPSELTWYHDSPSPLLDACRAPLHCAATFGEEDEGMMEGMRGCASAEASRGACVSPTHAETDASVVSAGSGVKGFSWSLCKSGSERSLCKSGSKGRHQERRITDREDARRRKGEAKAQRRRDQAHRRDAAALTLPKDGTLAFPECSYTQAQQKSNVPLGSLLSSTQAHMSQVLSSAHLLNARLVLCTTPKVLPSCSPSHCPALSLPCALASV